MSTFLQKLRTVTLGTAHDLLDKAIDLNSPSALRQYVRDLEDALDKLRNEAAVQAGQIRTLTREQGDLRARIETGTALARKYVTSNPDLARIKASDVVRTQASLQANIDQLTTQTKVSQQLDAAVAKLESRHTEMLGHVRDLERLDRTTKAQEQAARSLNAAGGAIQGGVDISIDDIEGKMRARGDVATEKFQRALGSVTVEEEPEHAAQVDELLASFGASKTTAA